MKHELRHPSFLCPELDKGNVCPACPKEVSLIGILRNIITYGYFQGIGSVIVSMDAIFGLPRKKSAGSSVRGPLHGHIYFHDQAVVDEFVEHSSFKSEKVSNLFMIS